MLITVNGVQLHYEVTGNGPALVALHSNCKDSTSLKRLIASLSEEYTVYALDSRGHGESQNVDEFHYRDMAGDVVAFIRNLNLDKPILYGHGDGGVIGLIVASENPDIISKLVVSGATTDTEELDGWDVRKVRRKIKKNKPIDPRVRMMMTEPNADIRLNRIKVPVFLTVGEYDVVNRSETMHILKDIDNSELHIVHNGDRDNYVIADDKLGTTIRTWLARA